MTEVAHRTRVKLCGVTREPDRDAVVAAGADAIGVIVDVPVETPREVDPERAAELLAGVPPFVTGVLVTMPGSVQRAVRLQQHVGADAIQIHGSLSPGQVGGLRSRVEVPVIPAVGNDDPTIERYAAVADALLVDSTDDSGGGGTGETHDWTRTRAVVESVEVPVVLAGGLTPENVARAIEAVRPYGVDSASGVESRDGIKDHDAVERFVDIARKERVPQ